MIVATQHVLRRQLADHIHRQSTDYRDRLWKEVQEEVLTERLWIVSNYKGRSQDYWALSPVEAAALFFQDPKPCGATPFDMAFLRARLTRNGGAEVWYMGSRVRVCPVASDAEEVNHA